MALKGTTPTFKFTVPETVDLTVADNMYASFGLDPETELMRKQGEDLAVTEHEVDIFMSQEDTLSLPTGKICVQLNWTYQQGDKTLRCGTEPTYIVMAPNMINEVLP